MTATGSVRALVLVFALNGFLMSQAFSRVPALRDQVDASTARLGFALVAAGIGSVVAMPWTARLSSRFGSPAVVAVSGALNIAAWAVLAFVQTPDALTVALFCVGLSLGVWDVSINVQGNTLERRRRRVLMPKLHAGFSAGTVLGALTGAAAAAADIAVSVQFPAVSTVAAVVLLLSVRLFAPDADEPSGDKSRSEARRQGRSRMTGVRSCSAC